MNTFNAVTRDISKNKSARIALHNNMIPGIVYGNISKENRNISVVEKDMREIFQSQSVYNTPCQLVIDGKEKITVLIRKVQKDVVTDRPIHIDLMEVKKDSVVNVPVPVEIINKHLCSTIKLGGRVNLILRSIKLECKVSDIPENIVIDIASKRIGDQFTIDNLENPPKKVRFLHPSKTVIMALSGSSKVASAEQAEETANQS